MGFWTAHDVLDLKHGPRSQMLMNPELILGLIASGTEYMRRKLDIGHKLL